MNCTEFSAIRRPLAIWALDKVITASPGALSSLLGTCQWFALLKRQFFPIFRAVYPFARLEPQGVQVPPPVKAKDEFGLFAALSPLLVADLANDYAPIITASNLNWRRVTFEHSSLVACRNACFFCGEVAVGPKRCR